MNINIREIIQPDLLFWDLETETDKKVLTLLSSMLFDKGYVKESFLQAVLDRETLYPTGLPTEPFGVAIPHTDVTHVRENGIGIAVLRKPVMFSMMGIPEQKVAVSIVFLLALLDPDGHLQVLKTLTSLFQNKAFLPEIMSSKSKETFFNRLKEGFILEVGENT